MLERIADGRTDLVFDYLAEGHPATSSDRNGVSLLRWCAYYGDVSAIRHLVTHGESLAALGPNHDLNGACFHGHWRLCQFLIEQGAAANHAADDTGETGLHAALAGHGALAARNVVRVLLAHGADPNARTRPGVETGSLMRDGRTRAETPLHRAAAFADAETIDLLIAAGAQRDARDMNGDSPLAWASWHRRPDTILSRLGYGAFRVRPDRPSMERSLLGTPHP